MSFTLQVFLPYCFAPRLIINLKEHQSKDHMSTFGEFSIMWFVPGELPTVDTTEYKTCRIPVRLVESFATYELKIPIRYKACRK